MKKIILSLLFIGVFNTPAFADFTGKWKVESGKSIVDIKKCGNSLCGNISWLKDPLNTQGKPKLDIENSNKSLRSRPIMGLKLIWGFKKQGNKWVNGKIYNPEDGDIYSSKMQLNKNGTMKLDGCVWIICKSQTWKRVF